MWTPDYDALLEPFDRRDRRQGLRYLQDGQVRIERRMAEPGSLRIDAAVQGSRRDPYRLTLRFRAGGTPALESHCSCPVQLPCKHLAAVLLLLQSAPAEAVGEGKGSGSSAPGEDAGADPSSLPVLGLQFELAQGQAQVRPLLRIERSSGEVLWRPTHLSYLDRIGASAAVPQARLLHALRGLAVERDEHGNRYRLIAAEGAAVLQQALDLGVCLDEKLRPLQRAGDELRMWLWRWAEEADLRPELDTGRGELFWLAGAWSFDAERGQIARVDCGMAPALADRLHALPPLPAEQWRRAWAELAGLLPADFPAPALPQVELAEESAPQPELRLRLSGARDSQLSKARSQRVLLGRVVFHYGPVSVELGDRRRELRSALDDGGQVVLPGALLRPGSRVLRWQRQARAEQARLSELLGHGARRDARVVATLGLRDEHAGHQQGIDEHAAAPMLHEDFVLNPTLDEAGLEDFCVRVVAQLRARGWRVRYEQEFPLRLMDLPLTLSAGVDGDQRQVGVSLSASIDGSPIDLWTALRRTREFAAQGRPPERDDSLVALHLGDGRRVPLQQSHWRQLDDLLDGARGGADGSLVWTLGPHQLGLIADLTPLLGETGPVWQAPASLRELVDQLAGEPVLAATPLPSGLQATLRPYQALGLDWLSFLGRHGLGGILADDMGLGKTLQVLAHILAERAAGRLSAPVLVVAPKSVLPNWQQEVARFAPGLRVLALEGSARRRHFANLGAYELILTTYPLLSRDLVHWRGQPLALAVFDESQMLKNPTTQAAKAARALQASRRLALTGTPLENHLGELWAQVDLVAPGLLGDRRGFERRYRAPLLKLRDGEDMQRLRARLRPFLLRRTKDQVAQDLPPKTVVVRRISLEGQQAERYEEMRARLSTQLEELVAQGRGLQGQRLRVLEALLRLRQLCCDPRLLPAEDAVGAGDRNKRLAPTGVRNSAKLEHLLDMISELLAEGRRILVFSQFTSMLALLAEALDRQRRPYLLLTGDSADRETPVRRFQAREVPLFLISLRAGGFGLNLTAADTVIHYDPWWNPAVEAQATDRAHRIGQDKPVFVYRLIARDTIEERILSLQERKRDLADALLAEPAAGPGELTAEDLLALLR
jgi:hypothetical protein